MKAPRLVVVGVVAAVLIGGAAGGCQLGGGTSTSDAASPATTVESAAQPVDAHSDPKGTSAAPEAAPDLPGPAYVATVPKRQPRIVDGADWTMPAWVRPAAFSGFFSEDASPGDNVHVRSIDVSWRQVAPKPGVIDRTSDGEAQSMAFDGLGYQLDKPGPYWFRMFSSGVDWAPQWVIDDCHVGPIGTDYDGQKHLPIWNACVWGHLRDTWRLILRGDGKTAGLFADPDFQFAYIPGAFTWSEFDYEMTSSAARSGDVTEAEYLAWYRQMIADFADIGGADKGRLVFTGEDYPWGPWPSVNLLATEATKAGLGIRNGITEDFNFHLNETPAYGSSIQPNGHLLVAETKAPHVPGTVVGTENECFIDCGFKAKDPEYVVTLSNLKALQLRMNWLYVVPVPSMMERYPEHWDWVRLSLGQEPETAPDAWAALRDAEDQFWRDETGPFGKSGRPWKGRPFVRNYERWLVQTDVPGAVAHRTLVDVHRGDPMKENGVAYEGLQTRVAGGDQALAFALDSRFLAKQQKVLVKVTYWDDAQGSFRARSSRQASAPVRFTGTPKWRTATVALVIRPGGQLRGKTDLWIDKLGAGDATFRFVRVVRLRPSAG